MLRQLCLGNYLPTHIRENTDFPWQKPQQLLNAAANLEGWMIHTFCTFLLQTYWCSQCIIVVVDIQHSSHSLPGWNQDEGQVT